MWMPFRWPSPWNTAMWLFPSFSKNTVQIKVNNCSLQQIAWIFYSWENYPSIVSNNDRWTILQLFLRCPLTFNKMDPEGESIIVPTHVSTKRKLPSTLDSGRSDFKLAKLNVSCVDQNTSENDETSVELRITRFPDSPRDPVGNFDLLSDDVLLILFSYLNSTDLYNLSL